ncbi:restriction endonuclease [Bacillus tianshenii]|uniref:restriction endonuclease n=1 Tax=Sutcliffiella tianshenii TaxID=1463404 RepID=UPI001CD1DFAD|nr:restriction endonuclease [Bacillus tianshenii]MCA1319775.1 restriction endonuclease [Bacillus tianshenii]
MRIKKMVRKVYKFAKKDKFRFGMILFFAFYGLLTVVEDEQLSANSANFIGDVLVLVFAVYFIRKAFPFVKKTATVKQLRDMCEVDKLGGLEFEHFLAPIFEKHGYRAEVTQGSGDNGADLVLYKKHRKYVVQAKCYSSNIGVSAVQQIVAAVPVYEAHGAMVVTNQYFTKAAQNLAAFNGVRLINRDELAGMVKRANSGDSWLQSLANWFRKEKERATLD